VDHGSKDRAERAAKPCAGGNDDQRQHGANERHAVGLHHGADRAQMRVIDRQEVAQRHARKQQRRQNHELGGPVDKKPQRRRQHGLGADGVIDAAGVSATLKNALELVRPAGWIAKVGCGPQPLDFSLDPLVQKNVTLQGSFSHNWPMWERVLRMLGTGVLDLTPVLGVVYPIEQWQMAFEKMHSGEILKSVLKPT